MIRLLIFCIFSVITILSAKDDVSLSISEQKIVRDIYIDLSRKLVKDFSAYKNIDNIDRVAIILNNDKKIYHDFYSIFLSEFIHSMPRINFYDKTNIEKILQMQGFIMNDFYTNSGRIRIGKLTPFKNAIFLNIDCQKEVKLGKKLIFCKANADLIDLQTGKIIWASPILTCSYKMNYNIIYYFVGMLFLFGLFFILNLLTKGEFATFLSWSMIVCIIVFSIWFLVI